MNVTVLYSPKVTIIARPQFVPPQHMPVNFIGASSDGDKVVEFGGRLCYMSQSNPAKRTTEEYIKNILEQGHGSVLEHATYSLLIEGISRSCSHELVRHRAGFSYSQLSQRYVDESDCAFVVPPAILGNDVLTNAWIRDIREAKQKYINQVNALLQVYAGEQDKVLRRKIAREAARSVLPNATETKMVVTANARAWRTMLELRCGPHAEKEIRRLALVILKTLQQESPALFGDFSINGDTASPTYSKV